MSTITEARKFTGGLPALLVAVWCLFSRPAMAGEPPLIDCPLRDAPFSLDLPVVDILLSPAAREAVEREIPDFFQGLPERMFRTEPPTFAAIITMRNMAAMRRMPVERLEPVGERLAALEVTDADRRARCARYDVQAPDLDVAEAEVQLLVFDKINGFDHGPSVGAATDAIKALAASRGWAVAVTDRGGAFTPEILSRFDAVVWNNVSGDVLTLSQREAFEDYIQGGGGFLGIHGSGGDSVHFWDWYADTLLGARFIGHPSDPQFQDARLDIEPGDSGIGATVAPGWTMKDEWYSFASSPRKHGARVVATLDESTYLQKGYGGQDLRMGEDHPIIWTRCVGDGRSLYTAIGHREEVYDIAEYRTVLEDGLAWVVDRGRTACSGGARGGE